MPPAESRTAFWEQRIERARVLTARYPFSAELLDFYGEVARFQASVAAALPLHPAGGEGMAVDQVFRASLPLDDCLARFPDFLSLVERTGTPTLAESAKHLASAGPAQWTRMLAGYWRTGGREVEAALESSLFFVLAVLQPYAAAISSGFERSDQANGLATCPCCTARPVAGVLRKEALGAKRLLMCSLCLSEWNYLRVRCPGCGEENFEALPVYTSAPFEHIRVEACDTCKTYIKSVDLTKDGHAIPDVDEMATVPLGLWAQENGYTKLQANLLGM